MEPGENRKSEGQGAQAWQHPDPESTYAGHAEVLIGRPCIVRAAAAAAAPTLKLLALWLLERTISRRPMMLFLSGAGLPVFLSTSCSWARASADRILICRQGGRRQLGAQQGASREGLAGQPRGREQRRPGSSSAHFADGCDGEALLLVVHLDLLGRHVLPRGLVGGQVHLRAQQQGGARRSAARRQETASLCGLAAAACSSLLERMQPNKSQGAASAN